MTNNSQMMIAEMRETIEMLLIYIHPVCIELQTRINKQLDNEGGRTSPEDYSVIQEEERSIDMLTECANHLCYLARTYPALRYHY